MHEGRVQNLHNGPALLEYQCVAVGAAVGIRTIGYDGGAAGDRTGGLEQRTCYVCCELPGARADAPRHRTGTAVETGRGTAVA